LAASSQAHDKALSNLAPYFEESTKSLASDVGGRALVHATAHTSPRAENARFAKRRLLAAAAGILVPMALVAWHWSGGVSKVEQTARRVHLLRAPPKVARVASTEDAVWQLEAQYSPGDLLSEGERLNLQQGAAQVSMVCGADILLQSPCSVTLLSANRVRLDHGKLTAQAAKWAKGFVVETDDLRIVDLGTRFAVTTESPGMAEAQVFEGIVRAEPTDAEPGAPSISQLVTAGQAVRWNEVENRVERTAAMGARLVESLPQFRPLHLIDVANTGRSLSIGSRDPRWRIIAGHVSGGSFPIQAVVCRPNSYYLEGSSSAKGLAGGDSQWISVLGGTSRGVASHSAFTFETSFDLSNVDPATVRLVGQILVDNRVEEIRLNGKPVHVEPWEGAFSESFQRFHTVEIQEGFKRGGNRLEIDVINGEVPDGSYNPMALRVEWQAFGCASGN
jgi:hypothetical protein